MDLIQEILNRLKSDEYVNIIISGGVCSGKSTLATYLKEYFTDMYSVSIIAQDDYYKNLLDMPLTKMGYITTSFESFNTFEYINDVKELLEKGKVSIPEYDSVHNVRTKKRKVVKLSRINIFEGLHSVTLLSNLDKSRSIRVYIDTGFNACAVREARRLNISESLVRKYWLDCVKSVYDETILPQKSQADIVIKVKNNEFYEIRKDL